MPRKTPYDDLYSIYAKSLSRSMFSPWGELDTQDERKYSWVDGLTNCPKCKKDVTSNDYYCEKCKYGEKESHKKKAPKLAGYDWVITDDYPNGRYFLKPSKDLFETVIIEDYKKQMIVESLSMVENSKLIFDTWGFAKTLEKGKGVSMLFHGVPGTGKTLMGQAIAGYLGKELQIITAAEILDKYVGESEQKITGVFKKYADDVILFDECDSLLYSRDNAKASWQISQVNVLLHELEKHEGVTIFTTNHVKSLDKALDRRISLKLRFEMPDKELRKKIWQRMFPKEAPLSKDIDWDLLADFEITGGYVKNAVLRAARITAFRKSKHITFDIIKEALKQELQALNDYHGEATEADDREQIKAQEHRQNRS